MSKYTFGLSEEAVHKINGVFSKHTKIEKAVVYGSRAKGNYKPSSDIDLVLFGSALTTTDLLAVENDLDDLLLPYQIDLSIYHHIDNNDLIEHINRAGKTFFSAS
ncbi:MAG: hypothetical protein COT74_00860 [Bdellovibrionales bacterium CG10_big_fil_rev_8_21_14_0_10_45_34]|nr:MAG: hypothetical protein COT74_00860 [Bdellovibrionales bacterium CG10_big_fil_rev_8_21_14_0_10_45_34]